MLVEGRSGWGAQIDMSFFTARDRHKVGASLADVSPMDIDMGVTFDAIGGLDEHLNNLKEMCMFPLLYPEVFGKFNMTPPKVLLCTLSCL